MTALLRIILAGLIAVAALPGTPVEAAKLSKAEQRASCEKAKKAGNYDTPDGRAVAKVRCNPNLPFHNTFWKERARQYECLRKTGALCKR
ncbi:hypothetical protein [Breoghania sp. JC706]|uniref:hypothetical protein n=1 Tax=Breoghania sp. JC706 TaxID=3117732 RepID=UPI003009C30F